MPGRAIRKDQRGNKHRPSVWSILDTEAWRRRRSRRKGTVMVVVVVAVRLGSHYSSKE